MAALKGSEKFVANSLKSHLQKECNSVEIEEGDDPPDIYLQINDRKIAVEITNIDLNVLRSRKTIDKGYSSFINTLNLEFREFVDENIKICLHFYHNYNKVSTINREFKKYLKNLLVNYELEIGKHFEGNMHDVDFKIVILTMPKNTKRKIAGLAMPYGGKVKKSRDISTVLETLSEYNLSGQTCSIVNDRIRSKNKKCENIEEPVWLALYDDYYNKFTYFDSQEHIEHYKEVFENIAEFGVFEKILIIFENRDVLIFPLEEES